ncbi:MAG: prephenate/arogenate dehydrogenase family protein [Nitratireductor sp.]
MTSKLKEPLFEKIALIGIGLIGSSLARVIEREGIAKDVSITTRSEATLKRAKALNLGTQYTSDPKEAVKGASLVILCVPVGAYGALCEQIAPALEEGAIITDVGSVKQSVVDQMKPHLPSHVHLVAGHPIAGTEYSGPDAGFATLFEDRWCILTPEENTNEAALNKLTQFWEACGSRVENMSPKQHDLVLAITSHIPHLVAYNIVGTADDLETVTKSDVIKYSAGGFRDFTRIAASDPEMWRDIFLHNKEAVLEVLGRFSEDLSALQRMIRWGDSDALFELFSRTRSIRKNIIEIGQEIDSPNFGRNLNEHKDDSLK